MKQPWWLERFERFLATDDKPAYKDLPMKEPSPTTDSPALFLERFERFLAIDEKPACKRTDTDKYDQTWLVTDTLRRIEEATETLGELP